MATNHVRRSYTEKDQARVAVTLQANDGNIKRTARETGVPVATVRDWKRKWEADGFPKNLEDVVIEQTGNFLESAKEVRYIALDALREKIERRELRGGELVAAVGMLTDKINIMSGGVTSRTEHVELALPDSKELAHALLTAISQTVDSAVIRHEEIEDADFSEQVKKPTLALIKGD